MFVTVPADAYAGDLSRYRDFQFGTDLATVAKQAGRTSSDAKVIHRRPALIQELAWRPQPLGWSARPESAQDVVFSFYNGELYGIVVDYDRNETEGLTTADIVEAISATYGIAAPLNAMAQAAQDPDGEQEIVLARWQDAQYRFELIRSSYSPSFRLVGVRMRLETAAHTAIMAAKRIDDQEAPQRDAARIASEAAAANTKLEKARLANKPKFRP
jgi:hypothetical protein